MCAIAAFVIFFSTFVCVCLWVCTPWCVRVKVTGQLVGIGFLLFPCHVGSRIELRSPCLFSPLGWPHILGNTPASAGHTHDYIMLITITRWYVPLVWRLPPLLTLQKQTNYEEGHVARNWGQFLAHRTQETEAKRASLCLETNHSPMQLIFLGFLFFCLLVCLVGNWESDFEARASGTLSTHSPFHPLCIKICETLKQTVQTLLNSASWLKPCSDSWLTGSMQKPCVSSLYAVVELLNRNR